MLKSDSLAFLLVVFLLASCEPTKEVVEQQVIWKDGRAIALAIPIQPEDYIPNDSLSAIIEVRLTGSTRRVLGTFSKKNDALFFEPVVALTRGLTYEVFVRGEKIAQLKVEGGRDHGAPELISIFPSSDTVPANLLKVYLAFSQPMQEGRSLDFVELKEGDSIVKAAFLTLKPELWNKEGTVLTLWLDPGRIKRDLKPNKMLGAPLHAGRKYAISVSPAWRSAEGVELGQSFQKHLVAGARDTISPNVARWSVEPPSAGTRQPLKIKFEEAVDQGVACDAIAIRDASGRVIGGSEQLSRDEQAYLFTPEVLWLPGAYDIVVDGKLEDLAGNNLNRLFDQDVAKKGVERREFALKLVIR